MPKSQNKKKNTPFQGLQNKAELNIKLRNKEIVIVIKEKVISNLMHYEFIETFSSNLVQNIKWVNVLENACPGHLENIII